MRKLAELREKRNKLAKEMQDLHALAVKEDRGLDATEQSSWDTMADEIERVDTEIRRFETLGRIGTPEPSELRAGGREASEGERGNEERGEGEYRVAFNSFLRGGHDYLDPEQRELMAQHRNDGSNFGRMTDRERRAFAAATGNVGGFTVPQDFRNQLEIALKAFGGMMEVADVMYTDTGATLPMPTFNYTAVKATIIGEGSGSTLDSSTPFGIANLGAFTYRSPLLPVSWEFLQDSSFGEGYIIDALSRSLAWAVNEHATVGTGSGQPRGVTLDATAGKVGATGSTVTAGYADLVDLEHSVDPSYRRNANWMLHDNSVKVLKKLLDGQNRPIWLPGYEAGIAGKFPDTILGYQYQINQDMPQMAANAKSILFGDFKKYKLRIARDITVLRLAERYADQLQVAFLLFMRADGRLLDAGTNPVKYYQNSAT